MAEELPASGLPEGFAEYEVIGALPIVDGITHESVSKGGIVRLGPPTIIAWLEQQGHVRAIKPAAKQKQQG